MAKNLLHSFIVNFTGFGGNCREYSGRGMFGKKCLGVDCDDIGAFMAEMFSAIAENPDAFAECRADETADIKFDSMGLGSIVYFPQADFDPEQYDFTCLACRDEGCEECNPNDQ